jgi:hypothetical protein
MLEHGHAQHLTLLRRRPTKHRALLDAAYQAASAKARVTLDRVADQGQRVELWAGANPKTFEPENLVTGGWGGIRTLETLARLPVFKTGAFNHSATHPFEAFQLVGVGADGNKTETAPAVAPALLIRPCTHKSKLVSSGWSTAFLFVK